MKFECKTLLTITTAGNSLAVDGTLNITIVFDAQCVSLISSASFGCCVSCDVPCQDTAGNTLTNAKWKKARLLVSMYRGIYTELLWGIGNDQIDENLLVYCFMCLL
jgi:hypothetical protein